MESTIVKPFDVLTGQCKCATILLNDGKTEIPKLQQEIWNDSSIRMCSIKAADIVRHLCSDSKMHFPTMIVGDIHNMAVNAKELFHGWSKFVNVVDKCKTGLTLCLEEMARLPEIKENKVDCIVVLGGLHTHRLDFLFGTLNSILLAESFLPLPIFTIDGRNLVYVLSKGRYEFTIDLSKTTKVCGLTPLLPCQVTTSGLNWDIGSKELKFSGLISSSNELTSDKVIIKTDGPLVFSLELAHLWSHEYDTKHIKLSKSEIHRKNLENAAMMWDNL